MENGLVTMVIGFKMKKIFTKAFIALSFRVSGVMMKKRMPGFNGKVEN